MSQIAMRTASAECDCGGPHLTFREMQVLRLAAGGLSSVQIGRRLDIGKYTVGDHFSSVLQRCSARSRSEAIARAYAVGIFVPGEWPPQWSGHTCLSSARAGPAVDEVTVRVGYLSVRRVSDSRRRVGHSSDQASLPVTMSAGAWMEAELGCLGEILDLSVGGVVVVPEPDRIVGAMRDLMGLFEAELGPRQANADAIPGICIELPPRHSGDSAGETLIFAAMPKNLVADLPGEARPVTEDAGESEPGRVGRPRAVAAAMLSAAAERRACGESVAAIAGDLRIGRSTLYRALRSHQGRCPRPRRVAAALSSDV